MADDPESGPGGAETPRGEVLLALTLGGRLTAAEIATRAGIDGTEAAEVLGRLEGEGLVDAGVAPDGQQRYRLSSSGHVASATLLRGEREAIGATLEALIAAFAADNAKLKDFVRRWQLRPEGATEVPNDHSDTAYDERLLRELGGLLHGAEPWLAQLPSERTRYRRYRERLARALDRAGRGEIDYVCGLSVDSVHSVWWQLHADLLAVLGRERTDADA